MTDGKRAKRRSPARHATRRSPATSRPERRRWVTRCGKIEGCLAKSCRSTSGPLEKSDVIRLLTFDIGLLVGVLLLVGRVEVEINSAERAVGVGLTEDDGQLAVERDAVAQMWAAVQVGFDGFF